MTEQKQKPKPHLWEYNKPALEPHDATTIYTSWDDFLSKWGKSFYDGDLIYWKWMMSLKRGLEEKVPHIVDFVDDLKIDEEYENYISDESEKDKDVFNYYYDKEYLLLYYRRMFNGMWDYFLKIYITKDDEPQIIEFLKKQREHSLRSNGV